MNNLGLALELLGVGMITVFVILFLVILIGNMIIRFVNHYLPEGEGGKGVVNGHATEPDSRKIAAIVSAVRIITKGRGHVTNVEKL
ncbi:MAG: OadG family protein [Mangrovibacterium sp.]|nr:OadG family protein [Mangrovibacterium sp.]